MDEQGTSVLHVASGVELGLALVMRQQLDKWRNCVRTRLIDDARLKKQAHRQSRCWSWVERARKFAGSSSAFGASVRSLSTSVAYLSCLRPPRSLSHCRTRRRAFTQLQTPALGQTLLTTSRRLQTMALLATSEHGGSSLQRRLHSPASRVTMRSSHPLLLVILGSLLFLWTFSPTTSAASQPKCLSSLPPHRFEPKPPRSTSSLTFCKEYASSTCCDGSHTQAITRQLYPYFATTFDERDEGYGVSDECRQLAASLHCAACHPMVGTGQLVGVCRESCDALYSACAPSLFEHATGLLQPCSPSTLVCSELSTFVRSGEELCRHLGLTVGSSSPSPALPSLAAASSLSSSDLHSAVTSFLSASHAAEQPTCFHASSSPTSLNSPATKRSTTRPSTASSTSTAFTAATAASSLTSTLTSLLTTLPALLTSLPTTVAQYRKRARKLMRSHASSGVSIAVGAVVVVCVLFWPRIRGWLNRQRWKARLTADGIRRQRVARLANNR